MRLKIAGALSVIVLALGIYYIPMWNSSFSPKSYCADSRESGSCVHCFKLPNMIENRNSNRQVLQTNQDETLVGYMPKCDNYQCQDLLALIDNSSPTLKLEDTKEAKQYIKVLGLNTRVYTSKSFQIEFTKSVVLFSKTEQPIAVKVVYVSKDALANCFLIQILMFTCVLSSCIWSFVQICRGRGCTRAYALYTIFKVLVAILILGYQYHSNLEQSLLLATEKFLMTILTYIWLIYAIEARPIIKYLDMMVIVAAHLLYQIGLISELAQACLVVVLSVLISLIACRKHGSSSFSRKTRLFASINLVLLAVSCSAIAISDGILFIFFKMFVINLSLVFIEPQIPSEELAEQDSVMYVESAVSTISIDTKYNQPEEEGETWKHPKDHKKSQIRQQEIEV